MTKQLGEGSWIIAWYQRFTGAIDAGIEAARKAGQTYLDGQAKAANQKAAAITPTKLTPVSLKPGAEPEDKTRLASGSALIPMGKPLFASKSLVEAQPLVVAKPLIEKPLVATPQKWQATPGQMRELTRIAWEAFNKSFSMKMGGGS